MRSDFAIFILTNRRPNKVHTIKTLKKAGYTGKIYIVLDDLDPTINEYRKRFDNVVVFDKKAIAGVTDTGYNQEEYRSILYARNASFDIARQVGVKYFMQLDDDYTALDYRFDSEGVYKIRPIRSFDGVLEALLRFYENSNILTLAIAQGGDFIGGKHGGFSQAMGFKRKAMNSFICSVDRPFKFRGVFNEDVNTYTKLGSMGELLVTTNLVSLTQVQTQSSSGGITELYRDNGTYIKSFYTVMHMPSCVRISILRDREARIHHKISWNNCVPQIVQCQDT